MHIETVSCQCMQYFSGNIFYQKHFIAFMKVYASSFTCRLLFLGVLVELKIKCIKHSTVYLYYADYIKALNCKDKFTLSVLKYYNYNKKQKLEN